ILVVGLHEATVDAAPASAMSGAPYADVVSLCLVMSNEFAAGKGASGRPDDSDNELLLALPTRARAVEWVAAVKRASFPPGRLWARRDQRIEDYAMSRFACKKMGAVWKAEAARTSVMVDSLRLCGAAPVLPDAVRYAP